MNFRFSRDRIGTRTPWPSNILRNPLEENPAAQAEKEKIDAERANRPKPDYVPKKVIIGRHRTNPANWPVIRTQNGEEVSVLPSYIIAQEEAGTPCEIVSRGKWPGDIDTYVRFLAEFRSETVAQTAWKELTISDVPDEPESEMKNQMGVSEENRHTRLGQVDDNEARPRRNLSAFQE